MVVGERQAGVEPYMRVETDLVVEVLAGASIWRAGLPSADVDLQHGLSTAGLSIDRPGCRWRTPWSSALQRMGSEPA